MSIRFNCPNEKCKAPYRVPDKFSGKTAPCKKCGKRIQVPFPSEETKVLAVSSPAGKTATVSSNGNYEFKGAELPKKRTNISYKDI